MNIPDAWQDILAMHTSQPYFSSLQQFVDEERKQFTVYPHADEVFMALQVTAPCDTRVVIVGQDPYHGEGQAHGLSFSVKNKTAISPSLRNIFSELLSDLSLSPPQDGNLERWAEQGVLLLNTTLTVRKGEAGSHAGYGWEIFTDAIINYLGSRQEHLVFVLWGAHAQRKQVLVQPQHTVITSAHPSPLSAYRGFLGSRPFSRINQALALHQQNTINW